MDANELTREVALQSSIVTATASQNTPPLEARAAHGLDGLHDVTVTIEHAKTKKAIYELETLLFEAPDSLTTEEPGDKKSPASRRKRGRE